MYYYRIILCVLLSLTLSSPILAYQERNLLSNTWNEEALSGVILSPGNGALIPVLKKERPGKDCRNS